jgi:hypothetical protein
MEERMRGYVVMVKTIKGRYFTQTFFGRTPRTAERNARRFLVDEKGMEVESIKAWRAVTL